MVIGFTAAYFLTEDYERRYFGEDTMARTVNHLIQALNPEQDLLPQHVSDFEQVLDNVARRNLDLLVRVGLVAKEDSGNFAVPEKLRGAVAKGVLTSLSIMNLDSEEDLDFDE